MCTGRVLHLVGHSELVHLFLELVSVNVASLE